MVYRVNVLCKSFPSTCLFNLFSHTSLSFCTTKQDVVSKEYKALISQHKIKLTKALIYSQGKCKIIIETLQYKESKIRRMYLNQTLNISFNHKIKNHVLSNRFPTFPTLLSET